MRTTVTFLFVATARLALACSCQEAPPPLERQARSSAVFVGTLTARDESGDARVFEFSVREVFKGAIEKKVRVSTPKEGSMCGISLSGGGTFLIFAEGPIDDLVTTLCSENRNAASEIGQKEIETLRNQSKSRR